MRSKRCAVQNQGMTLKGNFCIYKGFMDVFYFDIGAKEKPQNVHLKLIFAMCSTDLTCVNATI